MALKPLTIMAALGAVFFISSQSKAATPTKKTEDSKKDESKPPVIEVPIPKLPGLDDLDAEDLPPPPEDLPDLPDINDTPPPPKGDQVKEGQIIFKPNLADFYGVYLINNDEAPALPLANDLWISQTCQSWGIGKQFEGRLPAKYVFEEELTDPEKLVSPTEYWASKINSESPAPHYIANFPNDMPYRSWARNLIQYYSGGKCGYDIPRRSDYTTYKQFDVDLTKFEKTPLGQLYKTLYKQIGSAMYKDWAKQYPEKSLDEDLRYGALWAIRNYPKLNLDNQTDEAYKHLFAQDLNAPKKLDPKNPNHAEYVEAWTNIKQWIKGYKALIKQYGDFKDPLE